MLQVLVRAVRGEQQVRQAERVLQDRGGGEESVEHIQICEFEKTSEVLNSVFRANKKLCAKLF